MEFKSERDKIIVEKMLCFPMLGEERDDGWNIRFTTEFHMTNDRIVFKPKNSKMRTALYEGKMIWQLEDGYLAPRYWVNPTEARTRVLGRIEDVGQTLDSDAYRLVFRKISATTNERTLVSTIISPHFISENIPHLIGYNKHGEEQVSLLKRLYLAAFFSSFVVDFLIRKKITNNLNHFYMYQIPVPRLDEENEISKALSIRVAKLICTSPEYDDLAKEVGLNDHASGVTDATKRQALRAEIDAIVDHIYGLTEDEFVHILKTFPIVDQSVKDDTLAAFRRADLKALVTPNATATALSPLATLLASDDDEGDNAEFKSTFEWCIRQGKKDKALQKSVLKTIAAFLNSSGGLLAIGVEDDKSIYGLDADYALLSKPDKREWFEQKLVTAITNSIGAEFTNCYSAAYEVHDGKDVMVVTVHERGPAPAYLDIGQDSEFYVRTGRKTIALTARDMGKYISTHW